MHVSVAGSFSAEAGDVTASTNDLLGRALEIAPDSDGPRAYPDAVYKRIRFEVTANSDSDGSGDETFGVRLCTTADCTSGTVLGEWTVTITEPAADTTLSGTGATLTVRGGSAVSVMEDSANRDSRDRRATFEIALASAPTQDIVVVASTTTGVRTGSSSMGPFARINSSLSRDYPAAGHGSHNAVQAEYVVGYWPNGTTNLSREFTVISTDSTLNRHRPSTFTPAPHPQQRCQCRANTARIGSVRVPAAGPTNPTYNPVARYVVRHSYTVGVDHEGRIARIVDAERLGDAVRELRRAQKMTQADLAAAAGVPRGRISEIEGASRGTSTATVLAVLSALGYEIDLCPAPPTGRLAAYAASFAGP